jgi:hypothetical protein
VNAQAEALIAMIDEFSVPLRMHDGLDEAAFEKYTAVLRDCAAAWRGRAAIPRSAVNVLVDIFPTTDAVAYSYDEDQRPRIKNAAHTLWQLARESVADDPGGDAAPETRDLAAEWERFRAPLNAAQGIDADALDSLLRALRVCADAWQGRPELPRLGARVLIDAAAEPLISAERYDEADESEIMEAVAELQELVWECVAVDESEL